MDFSVHTLSAAVTSITRLMQSPSCHRTNVGIVTYRGKQHFQVVLVWETDSDLRTVRADKT